MDGVWKRRGFRHGRQCCAVRLHYNTEEQAETKCRSQMLLKLRRVVYVIVAKSAG